MFAQGLRYVPLGHGPENHGPGRPVLQSRQVHWLRRYLASNLYNFFASVALVIALFGGPIVTLLDVPDDPWNMCVDCIMSAIMVFFFIEIVTMWIAGGGYAWSFYFFADVIGTTSMVFEISFLLGLAGHMRSTDNSVNPVLLRLSRAARLGSRAARLTRLAKCFALVGRTVATGSGTANRGSSSDAVVLETEYDPKVLKHRLGSVLSSKVALLTLLLVMGLPLSKIGQYPEDDFSMAVWSRTLELDYKEAANSLSAKDIFKKSVIEMLHFYQELSYSPYELQGYPEEMNLSGKRLHIAGASLVTGDAPVRRQNILIEMAEVCELSRPSCQGGQKAAIYFDFTIPNQSDAWRDIAIIIFIIISMVLEIFDLSSTIELMVVKPIEHMLGTVQKMAHILSSMPSEIALSLDREDSARELGVDLDGHGARLTIAGMTDDTPIDLMENMTEEEMLEDVFQTLQILIAVRMHRKIMNPRALKTLDEESRGIIMEMMQLHGEVPDEEEDFYAAQSLLNATGKCVDSLPVAPAIIDSWDLDLPSMTQEDQGKVVMHIFHDSEIGELTGRSWTDLVTFQRFHEAVRSSYLDNPYHNYMHACDVTASVYRVLIRLKCEEWLRDWEMYCLLISGLAHDIAHPGRTTQFLVETRHDLSLRYNDISPLENMHCALLFEICQNPSTNIFSGFGKEVYKQARKVCITAIIHTDNALHFEMVKKIQQVYEVTSDISDSQAASVDGSLHVEYIEQVLYKNNMLWFQTILHLCDVSNPLKPWDISSRLAALVCDEFFAQGDQEKILGLPVGMLNDREKVSRSGSEHGFINFLVAPLCFATVSNFPALHPLTVQMSANLQEWRNKWVRDLKPSSEDITKRDAEVQKVVEQVEKLRNRQGLQTVRNNLTARSKKHLTTRSSRHLRTSMSLSAAAEP